MEFVPEWSLVNIYHAIKKGLHSSTLSPESAAFFRGEIMERTQLEFSIVLMEEDDIELFGASIRIYYLSLVDQINRKPLLFSNLREETDDITP